MTNPSPFHLSPPMERPNALYSLNNQKTAAGLDALLHGSQNELDGLAEYLSVNRVILGNGGFAFITAKVQSPVAGQNVLDANGSFAQCLENQLVEQYIYYMLPLRGVVLCLVAMPYRQPDIRIMPETDAFLLKCAEVAAKQFRDRTNLDLLVSISPTCYGLESIPGTYHRAMDMMNYHLYFGQTTGICQSSHFTQRRSIRLSSQFQDHCTDALNLLLAGQQQSFRAKIRSTLEEIRTLVPDSIQQYRTLAYQYLDMLCYALVDHHLADATELERTDLFWLTVEAETFEMLIQRVENMLDKLSSSMYGSRKRTTAALADKMKAYLQLHHKESNLTISSAAEAFEMTQPIFSTCFIRHTGMKPLDYLNKLRVQAALELLKETEYPLPQIAQKAGFGSVASLHRVFKKYTGMTPAQVRGGTFIQP